MFAFAGRERTVPLVALVGCGQQNPEVTTPFERPSDDVIEQAIDAAIVDSFALNVKVVDGEYIISGEWEADPNEDPGTQYWWLLGNGNGDFVPAMNFTSADARAQASTMNGDTRVTSYIGFVAVPPNILNELFPDAADRERYEREYAAHKDDAAELNQIVVNYLLNTPDFISILISAPGADSQQEQTLAPEVAELLDDLLRRSEEIDQNDLLLELLEYHQERASRIEEHRQSSETMTLRVQEQTSEMAELTTPGGEHTIVVCYSPDGLFECRSGITHCQHDPEFTITPSLIDYQPNSPLPELDLYIAGEGSMAFGKIAVSLLNQPANRAAFHPGDQDVSPDFKTLEVTPDHFAGSDRFPFRIQISNSLGEEATVAFRITAYSKSGRVLYTDVVELDFSSETFTNPS